MARVQILYWQEIPSLVEARADGKVHKAQLSQRFQELIDLVAMKRKVAGTDAYLEQWSKGEPSEEPGTAAEAAARVAAALEADYDRIRADAVQRNNA